MWKSTDRIRPGVLRKTMVRQLAIMSPVRCCAKETMGRQGRSHGAEIRATRLRTHNTFGKHSSCSARNSRAFAPLKAFACWHMVG